MLFIQPKVQNGVSNLLASTEYFAEHPKPSESVKLLMLKFRYAVTESLGHDVDCSLHPGPIHVLEMKKPGLGKF